MSTTARKIPTLNAISDSIDDEIQALKKSYTRELPEKLAPVLKLLDISIRQIQSGEEPDLETLKQFTHKIAGSSGTYGLKNISNLLRSMENAFDTVERAQEGATELLKQFRFWKTQIIQELERITR